jgi:hypothetical protein
MMECRIATHKATCYPEIAIPEAEKSRGLTQASFIYDVVKDIADQGIEYGILITTTSEKKIIAARIVAIGSESEASLSQTMILQSAILDGAKGIIFIHNHPGSNTNPSPNDIRTLMGLQESAAVLGIVLVDALIVSGKNYQSVLPDLVEEKEEDPKPKPAPHNPPATRALRAVFDVADWIGRIMQQIGCVTMSLVILTIYYQLTTNQPLPPLTSVMATIIMIFPLGWVFCTAGRIGDALLPTKREEND